MKTKGILAEALVSIPADTKIFTNKLADIIDRTEALLAEKEWGQKDLAQAMGKQESEVSKWFNTPHNLTLKSIAKLEAALGAEIIRVTGEIRTGKQYVYLKVHAQPNAMMDQSTPTGRPDIFAATVVSASATRPMLAHTVVSDLDASQVTAA